MDNSWRMAIKGQRKLFQLLMNVIIPKLAKAGTIIGKAIWKKILRSPAPSIFAESNRAFGT